MSAGQDGNLYEVIVRNVACGVCLVRASDATIVYASPRMEELFRYPPGELVGRPVSVLNAGAESAEIAATIIAEIELRHEASFELKNRRKDGTTFWSRGRATPFEHPEHGLVWVSVQLDITAEKEALEELRRQERLLREVFEAIPVGLWLTDRTGRIVRGNEAGRSIWAGARYVGLEQYGEYQGWWLDTGKPIAPDDWALARAVQNGETSVGELVLIRSFDGNYKTILNSATPLRAESGALAGALVVNEDVTDLLETEARYRGVVAAAPDGIVALDAERRITVFNAGAERAFGYAAAEVHGSDIGSLLSGEGRAVLEELLRAPAADGGPELRAVTARQRSGTTFPAEVSVATTNTGGVVRHTCVFRDVTARVRAEKLRLRLEDDEHRLATAGRVLAQSLDYETTLGQVAAIIVPAVADGCMIYLREDEGEITPAVVRCRDPEVERVMSELVRGFPQRGALHGAARVMITGASELVPSLSEAHLAELARTPEHLPQLRAIAATSYLTVPLTVRDQVIGAMTVLDVGPARALGGHDLALAEEIGRRAAQAIDNARSYRAAQRATKAREEVLAIVAHDLRTPLAVIDGAASVLAEGFANAPQRLTRLTRALQRAAHQMGRLISDLLDVAHVESGQLQLEREDVSPYAVLDEALLLAQPLAMLQAIAIDATKAGPLPDVYADRDRLLQVLSNLVGNALKFTPAGGRVTLSVERDDGAVRFSVHDTGAGIPPDQLASVFDRFWQGKRKDRRGAGLGLAIARGFVEAHGGRIWLESNPGKGTSVHFTLPLQGRPLPSAPPG